MHTTNHNLIEDADRLLIDFMAMAERVLASKWRYEYNGQLSVSMHEAQELRERIERYRTEEK